MIYTPYGHKVRRKAGFCDNPFEVIACTEEGEESGCVDLIGSFVLASEEEVDMMEKDGLQKKGKD